MSETTKNNLKSIGKFVLLIVVLALIVSRCSSDEEEALQKRYNEGYLSGYEDGVYNTESAVSVEFENQGIPDGAVEWCCDVIISRYKCETTYDDEELDEAIDILYFVRDGVVNITNYLDNHEIEVETPNVD